MSVEQLLPYVHPDAVYHRVPLPDAQNALGPCEAIQHCVPPDKDDSLWGRLVYGDDDGGERVSVAFPGGSEGEHLRHIGSQSRDAEAAGSGDRPQATSITRNAIR